MSGPVSCPELGRTPGRRRYPARGNYDDLRSLDEVPRRLGQWWKALIPGDYVLLGIAGTKHLFFRDPRGAVRHAVPFPGEGYLTQHGDGTVSAGRSIPSSQGGWEGRLERGVWIEEAAEPADRQRLRLPEHLRVGVCAEEPPLRPPRRVIRTPADKRAPRHGTPVSILDVDGHLSAPSRLLPPIPRPPADPGRIVLSDGTISDLTPTVERPRDDEGRVICRACGQGISKWLGCGCDPGEFGEDDRPLDPRYRDSG